MDGTNLYSCHVCQKQFTRNSNLHRHMKSHATMKPKYSCNICHAVNFSRQDSLFRHQRDCRLKEIQRTVTESVAREAPHIPTPATSCSTISLIKETQPLIPNILNVENEVDSAVSDLKITSIPHLSTIIPPDTLGTNTSNISPQTHFPFSVSNELPLGLSWYLPLQGEPLKLQNPFRDEYYSCGVLYYTRNFPLFHSTWNRSRVHSLFRESLIMSGAYYVRSTPTLAKEGQAYVLKILRSNLRNIIFREFMESANDSVELQYQLISAFILVQSAGWSHRDVVERRITDGYHSMVVTMFRKSGIPAMVSKLRSLITVWDITSRVNQDAWITWVRYESMKRLLALFFLLDSRRGDLANVSPCFLDDELDELGFFLPAEEKLWSATASDDWFHLVKLSDRMDVLGLPIRIVVQDFLAGGKARIFDPFSSFILINGIMREMYFHFISSLHDQHRYRLKQTLELWSKERLSLLQNQVSFNTSMFNWIGLFTYMLAVVVQDDPSRLVNQAQKNFAMISDWIDEIPDMVAGQDKRIKAL